MKRLAKTDRVDATILAEYAQRIQPAVRALPDEETLALRALVARRRQVVAMLTAEKNRLPVANARVQPSIQATIGALQRVLKELDDDIASSIRSSPLWHAKDRLYRSMGGAPDAKTNELALLWVLNQSDGEHSLLDIAERSGLDFTLLRWAALLALAFLATAGPLRAEDGDGLLFMGNPSGATADRGKPDNYLLKKQQYALSYNNAKVTANWASWVRHEVADVAVLRSEDRPTAPAVLPAVSHRDVRPLVTGGCEAPAAT